MSKAVSQAEQTTTSERTKSCDVRFQTKCPGCNDVLRGFNSQYEDSGKGSARLFRVGCQDWEEGKVRGRNVGTWPSSAVMPDITHMRKPVVRHRGAGRGGYWWESKPTRAKHTIKYQQHGRTGMAGSNNGWRSPRVVGL